MQSDVNFPLVLCKPSSQIIQPKFNQCKRFVLHPHFLFIYLTISILGSFIIFGLSLKYTLRFVPSIMGCRDNVIDKILCDLETDSLNYASYLIINSSYIPIWKQKTNGYWVGPFYKGLLFPPHDKFIKKIYIYKMFSNRNIYMLDSTNQEGFVTDFVYCKQDTIPLMDGKDTVMMSSDSFVTYTMKAKLYEEENGKVNVNNQPDTLVMPVVKKDELIGE